MDFNQLSNGIMLIGRHDGLYSFDGHAEKHIALTNDDTPLRIQNIFLQSDQAIWVGSKGGGVFILNNDLQIIKQFNAESHGINNQINTIIEDQTHAIWIGTDEGLVKINKDFQVTNYALKSMGENFDNQKINQLGLISDHLMALGTPNGLHVFDKTSNRILTLMPGIINALTVDRSSMWVGTNTGLYQLDLSSQTITKIRPQAINSIVMTIKKHGSTLWVGMLGAGLIELETQNNFHITQYSNTLPHTFLQDNTIRSVYIDQADNLWLGSFNKGIQVVSLKTIDFYKAKAHYGETDCFSKKTTYDFHQIDADHMLALQDHAVLIMNIESKKCTLFNTSDEGFNVFNDNTPKTVSAKNKSLFWIGTSKGLMLLNLTTGKINPFPTEVSDLAINFILPNTPTSLLVGTYYGLFEVDTNDGEVRKLSVGTTFENARFIEAYIETGQQPIILTDHGLVSIDDSTEIVSLDSINKYMNPGVVVMTFNINQQGHLVLVTNQAELMLFDDSYGLIEKIQLPIEHKNISILSIEQDQQNNYWLGTDDGLLHYQYAANILTRMTQNHGLVSNYFLPYASEQMSNGYLLMGGKNGFDMFTPRKIRFNNNSPPLMLSNLYRFNKAVTPKLKVDGFSIDQSINKLEQLNLSHRDYIISFEFNALNYIQPQLFNYFYQLDGFDPDWNLSGSNNLATYTNLPAGNYEFKLYYSDALGLTKSDLKTLKIHVSPPPWLSWWAIVAYVLMLLLLVYVYVQWKNRSNIRIAKMLRVEVAEKTKELQTQKSTVESLLVKKNELFSNVSHEFRTPLTLILGPIKEMIDVSQQENDTKSLKMINRNANRLLSLVEQLLQLARVSDLNKVQRTTQNTAIQVKGVIDSFQHLAKANGITLRLLKNGPAKIKVTEQCIDAVLGNLVSNAIKYTPVGGLVQIKALTIDQQFIVSVQDTGSGLSETQKREIFKRFKRLDSHQEIDGIGIGLSVVEEVVKINNGVIKVESSMGDGSTFVVSFPVSDEPEVIPAVMPSTLIKQLSEETIESDHQNNLMANHSEHQNMNSVLVIEDNHDMRDYITGLISPHYHCLSAKDGRIGVSMAIEHVPDIIISDVMMPEMDGFKVSRIIRSDQRTSHIPLILLTALSDKISRIKGWREHVDAYMIKPFDRDELLVQLENMLTIRDILKSKAGESLKKGEHTSLPKQDQLFITKLTDLISDNYQNHILSRGKLASAMAVSERQLQRKLKALIDQNPMDMLREFRLKKACELLQEGLQVSLVADGCGFNSLSYFSQCFKAQFGLSPKQYQNKIKEKKY